MNVALARRWRSGGIFQRRSTGACATQTPFRFTAVAEPPWPDTVFWWVIAVVSIASGGGLRSKASESFSASCGGVNQAMADRLVGSDGGDAPIQLIRAPDTRTL